MDHPIPMEDLSPEVTAICGPAAPGPMKLMAARGALPIPNATDLLTVLYVLAHDKQPVLATAAKETLAGLQVGIAGPALGGELDARVLDYAADAFGRSDELLVAVLRNPRTADETVERMAAQANEMIAEVISGNEVRLLRRPRIIEILYLNRRVRMSTVDRVIELAVRNGLVLEGIPAFREIAAAIEGAVILEADPGDEPTPDDMVFSSAIGFEDDGTWAFGDEAVGTAFSDFGAGGQFSDFDGGPARKKAGAEEPEERKGLGYDVSRMTVSQKVRLAVLGTASHRALLIRDPNRLVAMAAVKSPSMTDQEVAVLSQSRAVIEDVIRYIADNREWTKQYTVKVNLVNNPKTPMQQSLHFLAHLRANDLKNLAHNKNIPQAVSNAARQLLQRRPGQSGEKK